MRRGRYAGGTWAKSSIGSVVVLVSLAGCVERPSSARCEALADHVGALVEASQQGRAAQLAAEAAGQGHQALVSECETQGTQAEVECVLAAESLDALRSCAPR